MEVHVQQEDSKTALAEKQTIGNGNEIKHEEKCNDTNGSSFIDPKCIMLPDSDKTDNMVTSLVTDEQGIESQGDTDKERNTVSDDLEIPKGIAVSALIVDPMVRIKMLARVSLSDAHFRHQQRGEPDLTEDEKTDIAQTLLDESKVKFLARFGNYLELEDLEFFKESMDDYEVNFYVTQIKKSKASKYQKNRVKNRRFEAMKVLTMKGEYFSEDEMKFREPYLYEEMVGQYLTDDELHAKVDKSDLRFSTILLKHIDQLDENARFARSKDKEEGQEEEEEDSEDSENEEEMETEEGKDPDDVKKEKISESEKQELRDEFLTIMQHKFLEGEDKTFDYRSQISFENIFHWKPEGSICSYNVTAERPFLLALDDIMD